MASRLLPILASSTSFLPSEGTNTQKQMNVHIYTIYKIVSLNKNVLNYIITRLNEKKGFIKLTEHSVEISKIAF